MPGIYIGYIVIDTLVIIVSTIITSVYLRLYRMYKEADEVTAEVTSIDLESENKVMKCLGSAFDIYRKCYINVTIDNRNIIDSLWVNENAIGESSIINIKYKLLGNNFSLLSDIAYKKVYSICVFSWISVICCITTSLMLTILGMIRI